ncbi:16S rRNA (cytidine(1402)-2'-O)-methyltransferase [Candidatus Uhrbacteria bacterium]|nr:16S rRNA (cytidine(1402)-2'-O)-methyltransferase [Candidatus Uhrbacteria bacterium]
MPGHLSIIATPIGNLEDITFRALRILRECDCILCEDTRVTAKLLAGHGISGKSLIRFDAFATPRKLHAVLDVLRAGQHIALVSDAGTPGVSDPGNFLVAAVVRELPGVVIDPIPGASALTALASVCGIPTGQFLFLGFLPLKQHRKKALERIAQSAETVFFFESPHRIVRTLRELDPLLGDRMTVLGRELTKRFETIYRGSARMVLHELEQSSGKIRGEIVVAVTGCKSGHGHAERAQPAEVAS